jgi:hypothetical protein
MTSLSKEQALAAITDAAEVYFALRADLDGAMEDLRAALQAADEIGITKVEMTQACDLTVDEPDRRFHPSRVGQILTGDSRSAGLTPHQKRILLEVEQGPRTYDARARRAIERLEREELVRVERQGESTFIVSKA